MEDFFEIWSTQIFQNFFREPFSMSSKTILSEIQKTNLIFTASRYVHITFTTQISTALYSGIL